MLILLGNAAVHPDINVDPDKPDAPAAKPPKTSVTVVHPPDDASVLDTLSDVVDLWKRHSTAAPAWVSSDDDWIADLVAAQFSCPIKELDAAHAEFRATTGQNGGKK